MFKVNNRNTRTRCEICSKLTIKTPERHHWRRSGVFIVNFEHAIAGWVALCLWKRKLFIIKTGEPVLKMERMKIQRYELYKNYHTLLTSQFLLQASCYQCRDIICINWIISVSSYLNSDVLSRSTKTSSTLFYQTWVVWKN